jgi:hypothetical protein
MIFGQQFMVDALGLQFSGTSLLGGEDAVHQELARLRAAKHQYELAAEALTEALDYRLGSGCYISDYFMQPDWALFSRALEAQSMAQHEIAVRLSYLDVPAQPDGPHKRREEAVDALRPAAANSYINIAGIAGMGATQPVSGCARGVRPDGALAAEMARNLAAARRQAAEMSEGRNIFGYDVTFTPARFYKSSEPQSCDSSSMADRGLWDEAWCAAELAQELQDAEAAATREYNHAQADLRAEIENILNGIDEEITELSGCANEGDDAAWYACVDQQISKLNTCLLLVKDPVMGGTSQFDICMSKPQVLNSAAKRALWDLREVYVQLHSTKTQVENIHGRIAASGARSAVVSAALFASGAAETVARVSDAALNMTSCCEAVVGFDFGAGLATKAAACSTVGSFNIALQAAAGAISTLAEVTIEGAETAEEIANMLLDQSELAIDAYGAMQQYNSNLAEYHALLDLIRDKVTEAQRKRAYFQNSPANDPSFRLVRDSTRLQFSNQMAYASRMAYLAARRAEYEYAARLNASNVRFSDVYRARTANDLRVFLNQLRGVTDSLPGGPSYQTNTRDLTLSVAQHWLHLTDDVLISEGFTTAEAIEAERIRRFRLWVAENTVPNDFESPYDNKPVLRFNLTTSLVEGGGFSNLIPQGYDGYWLTKLSGVAVPNLANNGFSVNMVTTEDAMSYRIARVTQSGLVHLRSQSGCYFDYRLIAPSAMLGWEWASNQSPESAVATLNANINEAHAYTENGFRTSDFYGRSVSATNWEVVIFSGAPELGLSDMDLQQLTDIELNFSMTYASRTPGEPQLSECTRIDW